MIGIVPSGAVAFVSELFTTSISDNELFKQSELLKLIESVHRGRSLMADRGFDVEDLAHFVQCTSEGIWVAADESRVVKNATNCLHTHPC